MSAVIILIFVVIVGVGIWGSISFWTDGQFKGNRPDPDLTGFHVERPSSPSSTDSSGPSTEP